MEKKTAFKMIDKATQFGAKSLTNIDLANLMEAYASQFKPKWIKCSDRLPESQDVLCFNGNHIRIGFLSKDFNMFDEEWFLTPRIWKDSITANRLEWNITHWQNLPENPND